MNGKAKAALLMGALLLLSFLAPLGGDPREGSARTREKRVPPPAAKGSFFGREKRRDPGKAGSPGRNLFLSEGREWKASLFKVGGATLLVLLLAGGAVFLLSKLQGRRRPGSRKRILSLVETLALGRRKRLVLARASDRLILLGETEKGITLLMELDGGETGLETPPLEEEEEEEIPVVEPAGPVPEIPFRRILKAGAAGGR